MESTFVPFLKIRKWELRSSEMAHREAKTEYLGAYKFFYPRFVWEPTTRPTCHAGKGGEGTLIFNLSPPGGNFVQKIPPWREFSINTFLKRYISSNVPFIFLKRGAPGGELYLTFKKMTFSYSKGAPIHATCIGHMPWHGDLKSSPE